MLVPAKMEHYRLYDLSDESIQLHIYTRVMCKQTYNVHCIQYNNVTYKSYTTITK